MNIEAWAGWMVSRTKFKSISKWEQIRFRSKCYRGPARKEVRAVTTSPTDTGAFQQQIVQPVFAEGDAAFLNVSRVAEKVVLVGAAVFPVLTSSPTVGGPHKDSSEVGETTGAFSTDTLQPSRLQASFLYRRADASRMPRNGAKPFAWPWPRHFPNPSTQS